MFRRLAYLGLFGSSAALVACGGSPPPAPSPAPVISLPAAPPAPPPGPTLFVVPRAEPSPVRPPEERRSTVLEPFRSQGKRHALIRTADGLVLLSHDRGVLGFVHSPSDGAEIRWAGFVDDDAVLIATGDSLWRAGTPDDAVGGSFQPFGKIDPAATTMASGGRVVVAAVPEAGGAMYESRDGGRQFAPVKRPAPGPIAGLEVRDGTIVAAIDTGRIFDDRGRKGLRADIYVARRPGAWTKGPTAETFYGSVIRHIGDSLLVQPAAKTAKEEGAPTMLGLDPKGRWIPADHPGEWLTSAWTSTTIDVGVPEERPGAPKPRSSNGSGVLAMGVLGALAGGEAPECSGAECLGLRSTVGTPPSARAFRDGVCAREHVLSRTKKIYVMDPGGSGRDEMHTYRECDPDAPVQRASTLVWHAPGGAPTVTRLPSSCASGRIFGAGSAALIHCTAKHRGRPTIRHLSPTGELTELAQLDPDAELSGAEAVSDGTVVLYARERAWVCRTADAPSCAPVPHEGFLAARPLPGGRALVARRGASADELVLEVFGETGVAPVKVRAAGNVLEMEVTDEGNVRLWTSASERRLPWPSARTKKGKRAIDAFRVMSDGALVPDPAANRARRRGARL